MIKMRENKIQTQGLLDLISFLDLKNAIMLEVGSYAGESSKLFAESGKFKTIHCLDFWQTGYDPTDIASNNMNGIENAFDMVLNNFPNVISKHKCSSEKINELFSENYFDFIYIDANHQYDFVKKDILSCLPKLKNNSWIGGHDYKYPLFDVDKAVDEILGTPDKVFSDTSWIKKIEKL